MQNIMTYMNDVSNLESITDFRSFLSKLLNFLKISFGKIVRENVLNYNSVQVIDFDEYKHFFINNISQMSSGVKAYLEVRFDGIVVDYTACRVGGSRPHEVKNISIKYMRDIVPKKRRLSALPIHSNKAS